MQDINNNKNIHCLGKAEQTAFEYSGRPNEDIHAYSKLNPVRLAKYVLLVLIIHFVLLLLLWWAGIIQSVLPDQMLKIELSDSGGQFLEVLLIEDHELVANVNPAVTQSENQEHGKTLPSMPIASDGPVESIAKQDPGPEPIQSDVVLKAEINNESHERKSNSLKIPDSTQQINTVLKSVKKTESKRDITPSKIQNKSVSEEAESIPQSLNVSASLTSNKTQLESAPPASTSATNTSLQASARPIRSPKPRYPAEAIKRRQEGRVTLNLEILESGAIGQAVLVKSSGVESLDQSALEAVRTWQYTAAIKDDQVVRQWMRVVIGFELKNR